MKTSQQKIISILSICFLAIMVVLTLLSNTIATALLPKVTTELPSKKVLTHSLEGRGVVTPRKKKELVNESGWSAEKVHVKKNESVKKGQVLITFDHSSSEQQIEELKLQLKKQELNRIAIKEQYVEAKRMGDEEAIRKAKRALESDDLDRIGIENKIKQQREEIDKKKTLIAPYAGKVTELVAEDGLAVAMGQPLLTLVHTSEGFEFTFTAPDHVASFLKLNERVQVEIPESKTKLEGKIEEIKPVSEPGGVGGGTMGAGGSESNPPISQRQVVVTLSDPKLQGGEEATVRMEKQAEQQGLVIRKELLKKDGSGSYVFVVQEKRSPLGNTSTVQKRSVKTGDESDEEIVILEGLYPQDKVISESSEPLQDGNRIRLQ